MKHSVFALLTAAVLHGCLAPAALAERYVLVVGVNECPGFRLADGSRPRPLRGAESDARSMADVLAREYDVKREHMHTLLGADATLAAFRATCDHLAATVGPDDSLVLYFAGHGAQVKDRRPLDEEDGLDEALALADAESGGSGLLLDDEIGAWLEDLPSRQVTVILDCCHSGTGIKQAADDLAARYLPIGAASAARPTRQTPWQDLQSTAKTLVPRQISAFYACRSNQQAYERRFPGQRAPARSGQFTRGLLDGLAGNKADADRDGVVSPAEALQFVARRLDETFNAERALPSDRQNPVLEASPMQKSLF